MASLPEGLHWDRILFCAKEATYKAWFPLTKRWLGFEDAHIVFDLDPPGGGTTGVFVSQDPDRRAGAVGPAADRAEGPLVGRAGAGADRDRAMSRKPHRSGLRRRRQAGRNDQSRRGGALPPHLRHPQGGACGDAGPDGHRRAGDRHRPRHQDPRPVDGGLQVVCRHHPAGPDHVHRGRRRGSAAKCFGRTPDDEAIAAAVAGLRGDIEQVPSAVSAIKVDGRRAYRLVREGRAVELEARPVRIDRFEVSATLRSDGRASSTSTSRSTVRREPTFARWPATSASALGGGRASDGAAAHPRRPLRAGAGALARRTGRAAAAEPGPWTRRAC